VQLGDRKQKKGKTKKKKKKGEVCFQTSWCGSNAMRTAVKDENEREGDRQTTGKVVLGLRNITSGNLKKKLR